MQFKRRTLMQLADMICGNFEPAVSNFAYRSSSRLTEFFQDCDTDYVHDGSTRNYWVAETLQSILQEPQKDANTPPDTFCRVIRVLMDQGDALNEPADRPKALEALNAALTREGFEAFYGPDKQCYLRLDATKRSQILFMDREDILNLFIVAGLPRPPGAIPVSPVGDDDIPF
jgi:hypothetical protein